MSNSINGAINGDASLPNNKGLLELEDKNNNVLKESDKNESKSCLGQFEEIMKQKLQIPIYVVILVIIVVIIIFLIILDIKYEKKYNKEKLIREDKNESNDDTNEKEYTIKESGKYKICLYGANAEKGGKGCVKCAERYFGSGSIIKYQLGGKTSGGSGGIDCGQYKGRGYNGAGLSKATFSDDFYIVAGGGGGNSESGNRGGDCEQDGEGPVGGKGKSISSEKGGDGGGNSSGKGEYCGGGGGNGHKGGDGGGSGNGNNDGGGGGGSSYCKESKGVLCLPNSLNIFKYSKLEIYQKVSE